MHRYFGTDTRTNSALILSAIGEDGLNFEVVDRNLHILEASCYMAPPSRPHSPSSLAHPSQSLPFPRINWRAFASQSGMLSDTATLSGPGLASGLVSHMASRRFESICPG
jgi:hypothetical protein